ncbi:hypothetical protein V5O48_012424 [Marasmius crinis-equi]|uniref:Protein kinase domain-containing protein n=1 Tax=Marasmius crinis-equi TaxID=585013 RepID=A0ABR3F3F7_9AGAR
MALNLENPDDVKRELDNLRRVLQDPTGRESLLDLKGDEAQCKLDMLQLLADFPTATCSRSHVLKAMFRLSKNSGRAPRCLIIRNIKRSGDRAFGGGGFGDVWKGEIGESGSDQMECAIKVARWYRSLDGEEGYEAAVKTHVREAILWRQLKHPNVLPFLGMYYLNDSMKDVCLVSPFMANGNLYQFLKRSRPEEVDGHTLMFDIASGIEYLHNEDVVHGDLKELNILVREGGRACICDFGLSRLTMTHGLGPTMSCWAGTPGPYTAPEILLGRLSTKETDVYAFGTLCYGILRELYSLSDITAERGRNPPPPRPTTLPEDEDLVWSLLHECWQQEPSARPTATDITLRILPKDAQVAAAPRWDKSMYTTVRNNVDFEPLHASMAASQNPRQVGLATSPAVDDLDRVPSSEGTDRPKAEIDNNVRQGESSSRRNYTRPLPPLPPPSSPKLPYAVCRCANLPHAQSFTPVIFERMVQGHDLKCTIRAIAMCKRTDGFQHETLIPIISQPGEQADALAFLERAGSWPVSSLRNFLGSLISGDAGRTRVRPRNTMHKDIITLLPEPSLYWRYYNNIPSYRDYCRSIPSYRPFRELPQIIKDLSVTLPSADTLVKDEAEQPESARVEGEGESESRGRWTRRLFKGSRRQHGTSKCLPSKNSDADHAFIYAIEFPEGNPDSPTVLDLAIASRVVSEDQPSYNMAQPYNCFFFAAAICKLMERRFGGKRVWNQEFHESELPTRDVDDPLGLVMSLKADGLRPLQILRDDRALFTTIVDALVEKFEEERKVHLLDLQMKELEQPLILRRQAAKSTTSSFFPGPVYQSRTPSVFSQLDSNLAVDQQMKELEQSLCSSPSSTTSSFFPQPAEL